MRAYILYTVPIKWIHHDSSGVRHVSLQQSFPGIRCSLQPGHADGLSVAIIGPVQVISDPVHRNAFHIIEI